MYKEYYHFRENPFNVTSDPEYFFASAHHEEAFSHLMYGINSRKGIIVLTGGIGTGKTTLCRTLINRIDDTVKTALILNPNYSDLQLLQLIIKDLGIDPPKNNKLVLIESLNLFLLEETSKGNNITIIIDEAQTLKIRQLEQIRLLSNLETEKEKLLQIILVGQPELLDKLKKPELRQLNQRISVRYHILPLEKAEVEKYINHRLKIAGRQSSVKFTSKAIDNIYHHSHGTPRLVNILCERALLAGFIHETFSITDHIIDECAQEI